MKVLGVRLSYQTLVAILSLGLQLKRARLKIYDWQLVRHNQ
eukprot:COSAG05_NODE_552_length_8725_cov_166.636796_8_plen_41_part_00